jgi:hypothetical protein
MKHILDTSFKYTPSLETDLRKTFERLRREQRERAMHPSDAAQSTAARNVLPLQLRKSGG